MPAKRFTGGAKKSSCATPRDAVARRGCLNAPSLNAPSPAALMLPTPPGHDLPARIQTELLYKRLSFP
ncbi:hypothetical protein CBM2592_B40312 [Cupriavidus taiwanensis]|nr:hypothetical protein CBM2592_B40312 [Cupriavidus taiwanensis]SOY72173.1 hypothetical protein CBM2588_B40128 [Cupriavidus taiwanensis]SOY95739.1 hypothetical protein CBM2591_B20310 [Cupriavidus taiwanensis]SOZ74941.1 hypothetical protein CBM2617_B60226 [Cupriavidus taiwanensis]SOZ88485.1 hypothetical protein CBM2618_B50229 [Cupriavidus taiwanensis]